MAMVKINFQDLPSTNTPINAQNLNAVQTNVENEINATKTALETEIDGVVESGSNADGRYVKFKDGTMICTKTVTQNDLAFTFQQGTAVYFSPAVTLGSPAVNFVGVPIVTLNVSGGYAWHLGIHNISSSSLGSVQFVRGNQDAQNMTIDVLAVGRWK